MTSVMTVDDSPSIRKMLTCTLRSAGYEVVEAADGAEALALARARSVDLVLTDVNMPDVDGITLVRELRALPGYRLTPILVLTTESDADHRRAGKAAGATGWLVKPFNPDTLLAAVRKVLG